MSDPWTIVEDRLDLGALAETESRFALSNGHLGLRANLDEGEPYGAHGTYLNGFHELRPLPYAEAGYGFPESGQTVINVTNGKIIRLLVDDEPFDVRYGRLVHHRRTLDLRAGRLERELEWESPAGQRVRLRSLRMVSFPQRAIAAVCYDVEPVDSSARIVVQSELIANDPQHDPRPGDPRVAAALSRPLLAETSWARDQSAVLVHRAAASGLRMAAGMDHLVECDTDVDVTTDHTDDLARVTFAAQLEAGARLRIVKLLGYGWSAVRSEDAVRDQVTAAIAGARATGWDALAAEQRTYLDDFWATADVTVDGDEELQRAVRYCMFTVLQASARAEGQPIPAKGLTGTGYDGHAFWDSEAWVVPMLSRTLPRAACDALRWRHSTLPAAVARAEALRLRGASFPWRTIAGDECSGYWPAGTAAFHVNSAIAAAVTGHVRCTGADDFDANEGLEILVATARLWTDLGRVDAEGRFHIDGVTGPDEYSAVVDDNLYTNVMAAKNLREAAAAVGRHPERAEEIGVAAGEAEGWVALADGVYVPFDEALGVHSQDRWFTQHERWDFTACGPEHYPLFQHFPYFDLYRRQVLKQADMIMAIERCPELFDPDQARRDFAYYEALTVRDSSLSCASQGVVAARLGHLDLAVDLLREGALLDLADLHGNIADGVHVGAAAGVWSILVGGFAGLVCGDDPSFAPRCPPGLDRISVGLLHRGVAVRVTFDAQQTAYLADGDLRVRHHGDVVDLEAGREVTAPNPPAPTLARPDEPAGRRPPLGPGAADAVRRHGR